MDWLWRHALHKHAAKISFFSDVTKTFVKKIWPASHGCVLAGHEVMI